MATYYWVGGSGTWNNASTTNWAILTGGAGGFGPPTSADAVNFDANSGTAATVTVASTAACSTSTINKSDINLSLSGSPTFTASVTLTAGTLTLNSFTLTATNFSSSNTNARTIDFGTGSLDLNLTAGTIYGSSPVTNMVVSGTPKVRLTTGAAGTRTINAGAPTEAQSISFYVTSGSDTITFSSSTVRSLDFTGFTGTCNAGLTYYGGLTLTSGMTWGAIGGNFYATSGSWTITSATKSFGANGVNFGSAASTATWTLQDNLSTSTGTVALNTGTLALGSSTLTCNIFSSSNSNTRAIAFGTGNITVLGNNTIIWSTQTSTNFSYTGTPTINFTYSGSTGTRTIRNGITGGTEASALNFNISAGSDIVLLTSSCYAKNLNFTGFSGSWTNSTQFIYGNLTVSSGMTVSAGAAVVTFGGTSVTQTITNNNKTLDFPLTFSGTGSTFAFQDALTQGSSRALTFTAGTIQLKAGVTSTVGSFVANSATMKYLQSTVPGSQATISQASGTVNASNLTIKDIAATGGATWNAYYINGDINAGNNTGWDFLVQLGRYIYSRRKNKVILN
jgi:hypothetical protein